MLLQAAASKNIQKMLDDEALMKRLKIERCEMLHRKTLKIQVLKQKRLLFVYGLATPLASTEDFAILGCGERRSKACSFLIGG